MPLGEHGTEAQPNALAVRFQYNSISPFILVNLQANDVIDKTEVTIFDEFDDPAATLEVGTVANPGLILSTDEIVPQEKNTFRNEENYEVLINEILRLNITPGASTKGNGVVLFTIRR